MSRYSLEELQKLWDQFADIPINNDDEIEAEFLYWDAGTDRFEIWSWFDKMCPNGISDLVSDIK